MGLNYLTKIKKGVQGEGTIFSSIDEVELAIQMNQVDLRPGYCGRGARERILPWSLAAVAERLETIYRRVLAGENPGG